MDKYKAGKNERNILTLAFEKAALQEATVFHPWRYFVAGGETLTKIEDIISDYATIAKAREDLAQRLGVKSYNGSYGVEFDYNYEDIVPLTGTERVDYYLKGGDGYEPSQCKRVKGIPDFVITTGRAYGQFHPDVSTPRGRAIRDEIKAIEDKAKPAIIFAQWLEAYGVDVPRDPAYSGDRSHLSATASKVGNEWIVAVPVEVKSQDQIAKTYSEEWVVPPGATPITVSEYFSKVEKINLLRNTSQAPEV